jgi:OPT family oligopeptide transporter
MFLTQLLGTLVAGIINYTTALYLLDKVPNICTPENPAWRCPSPTTFYSASIIWGVIGPIRMFGLSSMYSPLLFGFLLGAFLPIPAWLLLKKYPQQQWLEYVHFPLMLSGISLLPSAPAGEYPAWFIVGFLFNFVLFRYAHSWWRRYAFLFSAAMSCGVAISAVVIFFVFQNNGVYFPKWWGTGGPTGDGCPLASANFSGILPRYKSL